MLLALLTAVPSQLSHSTAYRCCTGRTLRFAMTAASYPPWWTYDAASATWSGFMPELIHHLSAEIDVDYQVVASTSFHGNALKFNDTTGIYDGGFDPEEQRFVRKGGATVVTGGGC